MATIISRQSVDTDFYYVPDNSFWWSREGQITKWAIFFAIFGTFSVYMLGGYWHAKSRVKKGLPPLAYHRWLLNRRDRARFDPSYQNPQAYYNSYPQGGQYGMHPMPPPMYDPNSAMPPSYQPPEGATKVAPDQGQWSSEPTRRPVQNGEASPAYDAPLGPPPAAAIPATHTGASSNSNNPYRL